MVSSIMKEKQEKNGEMAEWSIASDLKSDELNRFREFESHFLLYEIKRNEIKFNSIKFNSIQSNIPLSFIQ